MIRAITFAAVLSGAVACAPIEQSPSEVAKLCDAETANSIIGTHVGSVSFPADANVRIVCTTCPTTRDYQPDRLNVRFNQATRIVEKVDCG
ncbi:hypothetical protein [Brevundimonas lenta]|uniref:Hemolysin n=1 Tax=Brevundimonas lenta TaxID=424796 RepID=A0A7W6JCR7_9CAUL|nr:hypothetical protein [Brevundimonas lenta]MBB4082733.1 hypothetical protein [Brevundimonas lenta]